MEEPSQITPLTTKDLFGCQQLESQSQCSHFGFLSHPNVSCAKTVFNTEEKLDILKLVLSPIAEAETIEGLFDVLVALGASSGGDAEDFAVGDVVFQLPLAEDHGAFGLLGARQQDVGGVASTLQQSG